MVILALVVMTIGSITDFQKREVADMVNYGLFISAIALRLLFAAITLNPMIILDGFIGFLIAMAIALGMFYAGQWGGGDSKMMMGLGILFGLKIIPVSVYGILNSLLVSFIINAFIAGSLFGLIWSIVLGIKNKKKFVKSWKKASSNAKVMKRSCIIAAIILIICSFFFKDFAFIFITLAALCIGTIYAYIFAKSVERSSMVVMLPPSKVTEGDWIDKEIRHKGKYITGPKDLGISKAQIALLKKYKISKIAVKVGIPFIPSFLIGFIITLLFGNLMTLVLVSILL